MLTSSAALLDLLLVAAVCFMTVSSQVIAVTYPPTTDASPAVIAAPENATNVTMYCVVTRVGVGIRQNLWTITKPGDTMRTYLQFNTDGKGGEGSENFFVTSSISVGSFAIQTNLTIRVFNDRFDMANISCASGNDVAINGTFILRITSE